MAKRAVSDAQVAGRQADKGNFCQRCGAWRGEHGLEPTLEMWLENEVQIFRCVRRVLRKDGTLWLNIGDAYASSVNGRSAAATKQLGSDDRTFRDKPISTVQGRLKPKDRLMLPARLAIALQEDGWYLRDEIIWAKPNPLPSSVDDRTTPAHEMLYLLSRSPRYFYDSVAIQEPVSGNAHPRISYKMPDGWATHEGAHGSVHRAGREKGKPGGLGRKQVAMGNGVRANTDFQAAISEGLVLERNKRSVWSIATEPFPEAHFATFPTELVKPCILAGTSERGCCPRCGAPWQRITKRRRMKMRPGPDRPSLAAARDNAMSHTTVTGTMLEPPAIVTVGWKPGCECRQLVDGEPYIETAKEAPYLPVPCVVLDPFAGSGTVGLVAARLGRDALLIELHPDYCKIADARLRGDLQPVAGEASRVHDDLPLFQERS